MSRGRTEGAALAVLGAIWGLVVLAVGVGGDHPLNDDWAYFWSARHLAETGEVRILDWAAPSLVSHIAWGALLIRWFGPSYVVLRLGTLVWAFVALLLLYGLGRRARLEPQRALVLTLGVGLSPWFVNLAFSYMTDVPWLALELGAFLCLVMAGDRAPGGLGWLVGAGLCLGLAALSRQFAVMLAPALALVAALDARRADRPWLGRWLGRAALRGLAVLAPVLVLYGCFHLWYTRVHGPTLANRDTWVRIYYVRWWNPIVHSLAVWHYLGLWLAPLAAAWLLARPALRTGELQLGRLGRRIGGALLLVFLAGAALRTYSEIPPRFGPGTGKPPTMPFLGNLVYLVGAGPLTIPDVYRGPLPWPHRHPWLGWVLTAVSTIGALEAAGWLAAAGRSVLGYLRRAPVEGEAEAGRRLRLRALLLGAAASYLGWHLGTATFIFDRYLLPLMPGAFLLALDVLPVEVGRARAVLVGLGLVGLFSVVTTREYLSWNGARDRAVRGLEARGVPAEDIDGGFEVNGPRRFVAYRARTHRVEPRGSSWWADGARYRISLWPSQTPACRTLERHPFWTWPGAATDAIYVLDCGSPKGLPR